jgi:hypothetical protein
VVEEEVEILAELAELAELAVAPQVEIMETTALRQAPIRAVEVVVPGHLQAVIRMVVMVVRAS